MTQMMQGPGDYDYVAYRDDAHRGRHKKSIGCSVAPECTEAKQMMQGPPGEESSIHHRGEHEQIWGCDRHPKCTPVKPDLYSCTVPGCGGSFPARTIRDVHQARPHNSKYYTAWGKPPLRTGKFAAACSINSLDASTLARFLAGDGFELISTYTVTADTFEITLTRTSGGGINWEVQEK